MGVSTIKKAKPPCYC